MANDYVMWDDKFSVNHNKIDEQHKELFNILNEFYDAFMNQEHREKTSQILERLEAYTKYHFHQEEAIMRLHEALTEQHLKKHEDFVREVNAFRDKYKNGKATITFELIRFIRNWLTEHILDTDKVALQI